MLKSQLSVHVKESSALVWGWWEKEVGISTVLERDQQ